jgi:hypothetical protein
MAAKFLTSTIWVDWICKFDQTPTQQEIDTAKQTMEFSLQAVIASYNNSPNTFPVNLIPIFEWNTSAFDPLTYNLKVYLQGDNDRPGGGSGTESLKTPPPPPPPPPL